VRGGGDYLVCSYDSLVSGDRESCLKLCAYNFVKYDFKKNCVDFLFCKQ